MGPLRYTVDVLLLGEWVLQQCPIVANRCRVAATLRQHNFCGQGVPVVPSSALLLQRGRLLSVVGALGDPLSVALDCTGAR